MKIITQITKSWMFIASIPAFATNNTDTKFHFEFNLDNGLKDDTENRQKQDSSPVYIKATPYTLPARGFSVQPRYSCWTLIQSCPTVNDYNGHTMYLENDDSGTFDMCHDISYVVGKNIYLRGYYAQSQYTWGDVKGVWSPDTVNEWQYSPLN